MPQALTYTATTDTSGAYTIVIPNGTYFVTASIDANPLVTQTYGILHRNMAVSGATTLNVSLTKLAADEQGWLAQLNKDRANISFPATTATVIDEYAQETARAEVAATANGTYSVSDATEVQFNQQYQAMPGVGTWQVLSVAGVSNTYQNMEGAFMAEKGNCPGGNWQTCTYATNTAHYKNLSPFNLTWIGLAESNPTTYKNNAGLYTFAGITSYIGQ
ncbi:MAG: hypothetical protein NVSMB64_30750 [Candidatus Velthaea sp.]